ncbi:flagellar biosynthetic protein FliO [Planctomycetota bacterium]
MCSVYFDVTGFKKKIVVCLIIAALGNGAFIVCSVQSAANETASEEVTSESNQTPLVVGSEKGGLFENNSGITDKSGYLTGQKELYYRVMLAILFVVVLGAAAIYVSKKLLPQIAGAPGKEIRILETLHLGPRKAVHLIEIGNRRFLIGSTNENVTKLADITNRFSDMPSQEINCDRENI